MTLKRAILGVFAILFGAFLVYQVPRWVRYFSLSRTERLLAGADRSKNVSTHFYGRVVDQDGRPVAGAEVIIDERGINENWAYKKGQNRSASRAIKLRSGTDGSVEAPVRGTFLKIDAVTKPGYQWLYDLDCAQYSGKPLSHNSGFSIAPYNQYFSAPGSPAIFVLVRDGVRNVSVAPSRGGAEGGARGKPQRNFPVWPREPSLHDVIHTLPSTKPASMPSE